MIENLKPPPGGDGVALALVSFIKYYRIILCMILDYHDNNNKQYVGPSRRSERLQPLVGASAALQPRDPTSAQRRSDRKSVV